MSGAGSSAAHAGHVEHGHHGHGHGHHGSDGHGHGGGHDGHGHDSGHPPSTFKGYAIGFVLSVILTAIPFWLVMGKVIDKPSATAAVLLAFAAVQIIVHMVYFLHMNAKSEGGWTMLALIFTVVIVVIALSGSMWVMYHLNDNMMPMPDMHHMP